MRRIAKPTAKQLIVMIGVFVALLLMGVYGAWSVNSWRTLEDHTAQTKQASEDVLAKLRTEPLTAATLETLHATITQTTCEVPMLISWQKVLPGRQEVIDTCNETNALVERRGSALQNVRDYVVGDTALAASIKTASDKLVDIESTDYKATREVWQQVKTTADKQARDTPKVKTALSEKVEAIIAALDELDEANTAKDRKAFDTAKERVKQAYTALSTVQDTATAAYTEKIDALLATY